MWICVSVTACLRLRSLSLPLPPPFPQFGFGLTCLRCHERYKSLIADVSPCHVLVPKDPKVSCPRSGPSQALLPQCNLAALALFAALLRTIGRIWQVLVVNQRPGDLALQTHLVIVSERRYVPLENRQVKTLFSERSNDFSYIDCCFRGVIAAGFAMLRNSYDVTSSIHSDCHVSGSPR